MMNIFQTVLLFRKLGKVIPNPTVTNSKGGMLVQFFEENENLGHSFNEHFKFFCVSMY